MSRKNKSPNGTDLERCGSPTDGPEIAIEGTDPDGPVNLFKPAEGTIGARIYWYVMWLGNLIFFLTNGTASSDYVGFEGEVTIAATDGS